MENLLNNTDYLSRQPYIDLLKSIIANQEENPTGYSFAIDSEWGAGKSWVLTELESQLTAGNKNKYLIFHYKAWENDFYDEPLVAILSVIISEIEKIYKKEQVIDGINAKLAASALFLLKNLAISFVNTKVKDKIGIDFKDIVDDLKNIKQAKAKLKNVEKQVDTFLPLKNGIETIKNQLTEFSKYATIIFVVDELDRCLPEYAIKVLERLHHVCNKMPVIQILAIDKKNLADSIAKVFGKDYSQTNSPVLRANLFCESYLQKFVDTIIPLPNGRIDSRIEILNGLERQYHPYIRPDNTGREFIKVDNEFLVEFVSSLMDGIEKRLQEKIFKQVELCHKLTIQSGIQYEEDRITYAILIYEIISCICRYVYHSKESCLLITDKDNFVLSFHDIVNTSVLLKTTEYVNFQKNIQEFIKCPVNSYDDQDGHHRYAFEIMDTKSYILAFFTEQEAESYDPLKRALWRWISEDKVFLKKYDEIMNILV